jgi:hypothetical protein
MVKKVVLRAIAAFYTLNLQQISTFSPLLANLIVVEDPHEPEQIRTKSENIGILGRSSICGLSFSGFR